MKSRKLILKLIYLFLLSILFILNISCNVESNKRLTPLQESNQHELSGYEIISYQIPDKYPIINISVISDSNIFIFTQNKIMHFDGYKFNTLYETVDKLIPSGDSNGDYLIFSEDGYNFQSFIKPRLYISKIITKGKNITISRPVLFNVNFSHSITAVKFIKKEKVFIGSILEYSIIKLDNNHSLKVKELKHYPIRNDNSYSSKWVINNTFNNILYLNTNRSLFYIDKNKDDSKLKRIFNFGEQYINILKSNEEIQTALVMDTTKGYILFTNGKLFVFNKQFEDVKFLEVRSLKTLQGPYIAANDIADISLDADGNLYCLLTNKRLFKANTLYKDLSNIVLDEISYLNISPYTKINPTSSSKVWLYGKNLTKIEKRDKSIIVNNSLNDNKFRGFVFNIYPLGNLGSIYGSALVDINNQEYLYTVDIYGADQLFRLPDLQRDIAKERGLLGNDKNTNNPELLTYQKIGVTVGDINESGSDDIIISRLQGSNTLYINNGTGYFRNATIEYNLNKDAGRSETSILGDINNDGYLDYFTTSFVNSNRLYLNKNGSDFVDITDSSHLSSNGSSICAAFGDVNNDGYLDLYVGNWVNENKLYLNNGNGTFRDFTKESGTGDGLLKKTNSALFVDFNNDGWLDLFVGNRGGKDKLFINKGKGIFKDISKFSGIDSTLWTYGSAFEDFDNDGLIDIIIAYLGGVKIYKNLGTINGNIKFKDITKSSLQSIQSLKGYNTSVVTFDSNKDGDIDIFSGQYAGVGNFYENSLNTSKELNSFFVELKIIGSESNRSGIGTKIKLLRNNKLFGYREVNAGNGYASSSSKIQHFGLPDTTSKYSITIFFPTSGIEKTLNIKPNTRLYVHENEGVVEKYYVIKKDLIRFFHSNEFTIESLKLIIFVFFSFLLLLIFMKKMKHLTGIIKLERILSNKNKKILFKTLAVYLIVLTVFKISQIVFFNSAVYINNTRNIIGMDILPFVFAFLFMFYNQKVELEKRLKGIPNNLLLENLFILLKKFDHGEDMLMNINRLSLLIQNIGYYEPDELQEGNNSEFENNDIIKRIKNAMKEFVESVYPQLINLAVISKDMEFRFVKNTEVKNFEYNYLLTKITKNLKKCFNKYLEIENDSSLKKILNKDKNEIIIGIKELKNIVKNIAASTKQLFNCNVTELIHSLVNKFENNYRNIKFSFEHASQNITAMISTIDIKDILSTIFLNAVEELNSLDNKDKIVKISCSKDELNTIIKIEDNGRGIPKELIDKIFTDGFTTKSSGKGFGLAYSKKCIEKFGGKISCEKSKLGGAKFIIKLKRI